MKGPSLPLPFEFPSDLASPAEMIATITDEILAAIPDEQFDRVEGAGSEQNLIDAAEVVALYVARFWHWEDPWWADEAILQAVNESLPVAKALLNAQIYSSALRQKNERNKPRPFLVQRWDDVTFFRVAAMRMHGISAGDAAREAARWMDQASNGTRTINAATIEKIYPKWISDPLLGGVWFKQLDREMSSLTPSQKNDLMQSNILRLELLPSPPKSLGGTRR